MADDSADEPAPEDGGVLSPEELDITSEDSVVELDDGRYVISPSDRTPAVNESAIPPARRPNADDEATSGDAAPALTEDRVHAWLEERLAASNSTYGFDITARFEDEVHQRSLLSNDVVAAFENLVVWYAQQAGSDTPVEDVVGILLVESNLPVRFPADALAGFAATHGVEPTDPLSRLLAAAREAGGVRFPPESDRPDDAGTI